MRTSIGFVQSGRRHWYTTAEVSEACWVALSVWAGAGGLCVGLGEEEEVLKFDCGVWSWLLEKLGSVDVLRLRDAGMSEGGVSEVRSEWACGVVCVWCVKQKGK